MGELGGGFRIGDCEVRPEDGTVVSPTGLRRLGPRPMAVLVALASRPGRVFSRDELMAEVWAGLVVTDETLSRCISDLRQALDDDPRSPRYIETLARRGYRLIASPCPLGGAPPEPASPRGDEDDAAANAASAEAESPLPDRSGVTRARRYVPWLLAAGAALALGTWLALPRPGPVPVDTREAALAPNGIAVLPFANLSDDPELEYFSDGLSEELIHRLASIEPLAVVARTSAFAFKGTHKDVREIGRALGVAYVLEGSVRRHGDRVRIGAQLIDVQSGFRLFSRVYERPFSDVFAIQDHVAMEVGAALEPRLAARLDPPSSAAEETTPEAFEAYLLGKHLQRKVTVESLERAAREFRRAIELDPQFARAHAGLAETLALTGQYAEQPISGFHAEIEALIRTALQLDPRCTLAYHARGLLAFYENRLPDALEAFATVQALDPNAIGSISMQAWTLRAMGRNQEALARTALALARDPINVHAMSIQATLLAQLGRFEEAERAWLRAMEIDSAYLNAWWGIGYLNWLAGRHAEAAHWYRQGIERGIRQGHAYAELGRVLLELDEIEQSREWIDAALARSANPLGLLDALVAWHQYQGDFAGLAQAIEEWTARYPEHAGMAPWRALSALMNGDAQTALREYEGLAARDPDRFHNHWDMASGYWHALYFARARQLAGQEDAAEQTLAEAERRLARFEQETGYPGIAAYYRAAIASLRNDRVRARDFLEQAHEHGWRRHAQVRTSPLFVPIRDDAEIAMLLDAVRRLLERARTSVSAAGAP